MPFSNGRAFIWLRRGILRLPNLQTDDWTRKQFEGPRTKVKAVVEKVRAGKCSSPERIANDYTVLLVIFWPVGGLVSLESPSNSFIAGNLIVLGLNVLSHGKVRILQNNLELVTWRIDWTESGNAYAR